MDIKRIFRILFASVCVAALVLVFRIWM